MDFFFPKKILNKYSWIQLQKKFSILSVERLTHLKGVPVDKQLWFHIQAHSMTGIMHGSKVFRYEQVTFPFTVRTCLKDGQDFNYSGTKNPPL